MAFGGTGLVGPGDRHHVVRGPERDCCGEADALPRLQAVAVQAIARDWDGSQVSCVHAHVVRVGVACVHQHVGAAGPWLQRPRGLRLGRRARSGQRLSLGGLRHLLRCVRSASRGGSGLLRPGRQGVAGLEGWCRHGPPKADSSLGERRPLPAERDSRSSAVVVHGAAHTVATMDWTAAGVIVSGALGVSALSISLWDRRANAKAVAEADRRADRAQATADEGLAGT